MQIKPVWSCWDDLIKYFNDTHWVKLACSTCRGNSWEHTEQQTPPLVHMHTHAHLPQLYLCCCHALAEECVCRCPLQRRCSKHSSHWVCDLFVLESQHCLLCVLKDKTTVEMTPFFSPKLKAGTLKMRDLHKMLPAHSKSEHIEVEDTQLMCPSDHFYILSWPKINQVSKKTQTDL